MNYNIKASSIANQEASIQIKQSNIKFGIIAEAANTLPNPAELFLGSLAACILKNVERFSYLMKFSYISADIEINATRLENPPRMEDIKYTLVVTTTDEKLNIELLHKNLMKHGTIYNTVNSCCNIDGIIQIKK